MLRQPDAPLSAAKWWKTGPVALLPTRNLHNRRDRVLSDLITETTFQENVVCSTWEEMDDICGAP